MNNNSYSSNQILIDTSSFSNSGKYVNYNEAYLSVPLVLGLYPTTASTTAAFDSLQCPFAAGFKNGFWNIIDSLSVEYNNTTVIQLTRTSNYYLNYKMTAALSMSDVEKFGSTIGFWPDSVDAFTYNAAASADGRGIANNKNMGFEMLYPSNKGILYNAAAVNNGASPVAIGNTLQGAAFTGLYATNYPTLAGTQTVANFGFYMRQKAIAYDPSVAPYSTFLDASATSELAKSYFASIANGSTANAGIKVWRVTAIIYLKHLHDFFHQIIPVKGAYLRFVINVNQGTATFTSSLQAATTTTPAVTKFTQTSHTFPNNTCPVMLASSQPGQGAALIDLDGSLTWKLQVGIASITPAGASGNTTTITHPQTNVRLYAPLYTFDPNKEDAYLSINGIKKIVYRDIYQFLTPVDAGSSMNVLLSNGIVNPKAVVICPFLRATSNGGLGLSPTLSAFATEPATVQPLAYFKSFNVLVAGVNAMMLNEDYAWQNFVDQANHHWALNGGLSEGITSGLVNEYNYGLGFGWIVVDISRRIKIEDSVPKSIQLVGQSKSLVNLDLYSFVETERTIAINIRSGELVKS